MAVSGVVQKFETLQDGSLKLSVYVPKEQITAAVQLVYQPVEFGIIQDKPTGEAVQIGRTADQSAELLETIERGCQAMIEAIQAQRQGKLPAELSQAALSATEEETLQSAPEINEALIFEDEEEALGDIAVY